MATPTWSSPRSGVLGDTGAVNSQNQLNQLLGTHGIVPVYQGKSILTPVGSGGDAWAYQLSTMDIAQPFTMSGTAIGRVVVPLLPVGDGADLIVSLYTNSGGAPGTLINSTRIPASHILQQAAVAAVPGPSSEPPVTALTGNPLAIAQNNTPHLGPVSSVPWPLPTVTAAGAAYEPSATSYGNYLILVGGLNQVGGTTWLPNVFTVFADGSGTACPAVPQPSLPIGLTNAMVAVTADPADGTLTVIVAGGNTSLGNPVSTVFTASFDASSGVISAWSQQASLPVGLYYAGIACSNGFVYLLGGTTTTGGATIATAYQAQVINGQITGWSTITPLPAPSLSASIPLTAALDGNVFIDYWDFNGNHRALYAPINADGTLGAWQTLLTSPDNTSFTHSNNIMTTGDSGVFINWIDKFTTMGWSAYGPDTAWTAFTAPANVFIGGNWQLMAPNGDGTWQYYGFGVPPAGTTPAYFTAPVTLTPRISVPLPTTGLTSGTTYHVVLSQPNGDLNNYLRTHDDFDVFPGNPTALFRAVGSSSWTAGMSGHAVPLQVFDNSASGPVMHLVDDGGARINTIVQATLPGQNVIGLLEATAQPGPVLNQWPTFTRGVGPWHPTGATLTTSSAHTHGNLPVSALLTPSGTASLAFAESDLVAARQGHSYVLTAWYFSTTGYSDVNLSANWFDANRNYLSTSSGTSTAIPANTWTMFQTTVANNVANAVYLDVVVIEGSTPPVTALLYVSVATAQDASGPMLSTVSQLTYNGQWPSPTAPLLTGLTVLA